MKLPRLLLYYSTVASLFLTLSGFISVKEIQNATFQLLLLPVTMFLFLGTTADIRDMLSKKESPSANPKTRWSIFGGFALLYAVLLIAGLRNISLSQAKSEENKETPASDSAPIVFQTNSEPILVKAVQSNNEIYLKTTPTDDAEVIRATDPSEQFEVTEETDEWYQVKLEDSTFGYLKKMEVEIVK